MLVVSLPHKSKGESDGGARELCEPILLYNRQVANEGLCCLHHLVVDDPARRRLACEEDRRRMDVQDL